jgi:membrane associated rhomboid family serine protease
MFSATPRITKNIIFLNLILFLVSAFSPIDLGILLGGFYPDSVNFKPHQIVSHMFMHASLNSNMGFLHILFNMYGLFMFGSILERSLGEKKFFILYSLSGLGSFLLFNFVNYLELNPLKELLLSQGVDWNKFQLFSQLDLRVDSIQQINNHFSAWISSLPKETDFEASKNLFLGYTTPMIGASGAIFGLMAAFAALYPNLVLQLLFPPIALKAKYFIAILIGIDLFYGFKNNAGDNIAHFAHVGGALVGIILIKFWKKNPI